MSDGSRPEPSLPDVPADAWPLIKDLFWELHSLEPHERESRLRAFTGDRTVTDYAQRLLSSADSMGERFQQPAIDALGIEIAATDSADADSPTIVGRTLGRYRVIRRIGQGGMGAVYEAVRSDDSYDQRVAIKTLWRGADSTVLLQRFRSERQILAGLQHPNIARLIDGGATDEGTPYLVMEMVDGVPIDRFCDDNELGIVARLDLFRQVCAAVQHAHSNLVVHRDLKPSNVLVTASGAVKLLDFGVAKLLDDPRSEGTLTGAGLSPFTRAYAAPEQMEGGSVSTATDVYALGVLLFSLLAGSLPFGSHPHSGKGRVRSAAPPSSVATDAAALARSLPNATRLARVLRGDLDAIVLAAVREDPARRYATVDAMSEDVHRYLRGERVLARPDTLAYRARIFVRRRRAVVSAGALAVIALLAVSAVAFRQARQSRLEAARSEHIASFLTLMSGSPDVNTGSTLLRRGTSGTITDMLDSALVRVPSTFPDDPKIRARLYTSIGASYIAQSRMRAAASVLDSALLLARASYGPRSDEFVEASLSAADAAVHRSPVPVTTRYAISALLALRGRETSSPQLYGRALATMATARYLSADFRGADSLAREAIAVELARTRQPTLTRAWATRLRAGVRMFHEDWTGVDTLAAHSVAIADSLGSTFAFERLDAIFERSEALRTLGNVALADSLTRMGLDDSRRGYGPASREAAIFLAQSAALARLHGDTARSRALADTARRIIDSIPEVNAQVRAGVAIPAINEFWARRDFAGADTLARSVLAGAEQQQDPVAIAVGSLYAGLSGVFTGDLATAERDFRRGLDVCPRDGDMELIARTLRAELAVTVGTTGRQREADSLFATLPHAQADEARAALAVKLARKRAHR
jgi:serine/threonine-protein kinase